MVIVLHLGAHKTATTYIQNALELSRDKLAADKVGYVPLAELRSSLMERLGFGRRGLANAAGRLLQDHASAKRLVISEENIIGGLKPGRSGYYENRRRRLAKLLKALGSHDIRICFAIRSYDEFISAMYCEYIRHLPFVSLQSYLGSFDPRGFGWPSIIRTFVDVAGASNVVIWRFEDFQRIQDQVFSALTDAPSDLVRKPGDRVRESLSARAVESLASLGPARDLREIRARTRAAATAHPKGLDNPTFSAFDPAAAERLRARYERDVSSLLQDYPDIRFLGLRD